MTADLVAIVLNWNGEHDTAACLDALMGQEQVAMEILLVDNGSLDGSGERLRVRYPTVKYLQTGANLGYAGGNNRGIEWAVARGAEWVLVVNNDTVADVACVHHLITAARLDGRIGALAPLIVRFDAPDRIWFAGGSLSLVRALGRHDAEGRTIRDIAIDGPDAEWRQCTFLTGCCILFRARALADTGLFREDFFAYVEDVELSLRLTRAGWLLGWVPAARLAHRVPAEGLSPSPMQIVLRDRNRRRMVRALYPWYLRLIFLGWFWPTRIISLLRYMLGGDWERSRAILKGASAR